MRCPRRALSTAALLLAWLCAQGSLMESVQVFAWVRMFTTYTQTLDWTDALRETFDPGKPCEICRAVMKASAEERRSPTPPPASDNAKLVLAPGAVDEAPPPAVLTTTFRRAEFRAIEWTPAVPTPPPRPNLA